ncbi:MAG TPA: hypothetical protein VG992_03090 [Candidatus Saccharimonadales bacterium]|nr:hypothetical protein [Candidatus Saccharimonadales bacterium]
MTVNFDTTDIEVKAVRFSHQAEQVRFESYPRRIMFKGREYILAEVAA